MTSKKNPRPKRAATVVIFPRQPRMLTAGQSLLLDPEDQLRILQAEMEATSPARTRATELSAIMREALAR